MKANTFNAITRAAGWMLIGLSMMEITGSLANIVLDDDLSRSVAVVHLLPALGPWRMTGENLAALKILIGAAGLVVGKFSNRWAKEQLTL